MQPSSLCSRRPCGCAPGSPIAPGSSRRGRCTWTTNFGSTDVPALDVGHECRVRTLGGPPARDRDALAQVAPAELVLRQEDDTGVRMPALGAQEDLAAANEVDARLARSKVAPDNARDRGLVGESDRAVELGAGALDHFLRVRGAHEEGEVRSGMEFGVGRRLVAVHPYSMHARGSPSVKPGDARSGCVPPGEKPAGTWPAGEYSSPRRRERQGSAGALPLPHLSGRMSGRHNPMSLQDGTDIALCGALKMR